MADDKAAPACGIEAEAEELDMVDVSDASDAVLARRPVGASSWTCSMAAVNAETEMFNSPLAPTMTGRLRAGARRRRGRNDGERRTSLCASPASAQPRRPKTARANRARCSGPATRAVRRARESLR